MLYFSHDINTRSKKKIKQLLFYLGWKGYGVYWGLIEYMHENEFLLCDIDLISNEFNINSDFLKSIIYDFKLFKIYKNKIISPRVRKNIKKQKEISELKKKAALIRWDKYAKEKGCFEKIAKEIKRRS